MPNMIWKYIRSSKQYQYPITDEFQPLTVTVKYNDVITSLSGYHMFLNDVIGSDARHSKFLIVQHLFFRRKLVAGSVEWYHFRLCIQLMRKFTMQTSIEKMWKCSPCTPLICLHEDHSNWYSINFQYLHEVVLESELFLSKRSIFQNCYHRS